MTKATDREVTDAFEKWLSVHFSWGGTPPSPVTKEYALIKDAYLSGYRSGERITKEKLDNV